MDHHQHRDRDLPAHAGPQARSEGSGSTPMSPGDSVTASTQQGTPRSRQSSTTSSRISSSIWKASGAASA
ncbi:MAG: hypothetical protein ACK559_36755, partial [bacterium]